MDDPKKITPNDLKKTPQLWGSVDLFDINILPVRHRRQKVTLMKVLPWLILPILIGTLYPAGINALDAQNEFQEKRIGLLLAQAELEIMQTNTQSLENIQSEIASEIEKRNLILDSYGGINLHGTNWNETLGRIHQITPPAITWNSISQQGDEITLEGIATGYQNVIDLSDSLNDLRGLQSAEIIFLEQVLNEDLIDAPAVFEGEAEAIVPNPAPFYAFTILSIAEEEVLP